MDEKNLRLAFDMFDINKDGKLSKDELKTVLDTTNLEYIDILMRIIDNNKVHFKKSKRIDSVKSIHSFKCIIEARHVGLTSLLLYNK